MDRWPGGRVVTVVVGDGVCSRGSCRGRASGGLGKQGRGRESGRGPNPAKAVMRETNRQGQSGLVLYPSLGEMTVSRQRRRIRRGVHAASAAFGRTTWIALRPKPQLENPRLFFCRLFFFFFF